MPLILSSPPSPKSIAFRAAADSSADPPQLRIFPDAVILLNSSPSFMTVPSYKPSANKVLLPLPRRRCFLSSFEISLSVSDNSDSDSAIKRRSQVPPALKDVYSAILQFFIIFIKFLPS